MVQAFAPFIEVAKDWDGFDEFLPRLEVFKDGFLEKVKKTYAVNKSEFGFNVLNHADFHVKNMLFKKTEDGGVDDFYIVSHSRLLDELEMIFYDISRSIIKSAITPRQRSI